MNLNLTDIQHYAARAQGAIMREVDRVPDTELRASIRRAVMDQVELFRHRVVVNALGLDDTGYRDQGGKDGSEPHA